MAYITNRTARRDYEIMETVRAGMSLTGTETKSIRNGKGSLTGAKVLIRGGKKGGIGGEIYLVGANIPPYQEKNAPPDYDPERTRTLLMRRKEIEKLKRQVENGGLTLIPLSVYNVNRVLKLDIGIARKKNARDKREIIKKRESERSIRQSVRRIT